MVYLHVMTRPLQLQSRVGDDGVLTLRVALSAEDAGRDVTVTIEPTAVAVAEPQRSAWPPGYFEATFGSSASDPIEEPADPPPPPETLD